MSDRPVWSEREPDAVAITAAAFVIIAIMLAAIPMLVEIPIIGVILDAEIAVIGVTAFGVPALSMPGLGLPRKPGRARESPGCFLVICKQMAEYTRGAGTLVAARRKRSGPRNSNRIRVNRWNG